MSDVDKKLFMAKIVTKDIVRVFWDLSDGYREYIEDLDTFLSSDENKIDFIESMSELVQDGGDFNELEQGLINKACSLYFEAALKKSSSSESDVLNFLQNLPDD